MPHGYDYGNARLRAMRSRFFTLADFDRLLASDDIEELISELAKTSYQDDVETALLKAGKNRCVIEAVRTNFTRTVAKIRHFYEDEPRELLELLLRRWDRQSLLAVLRGQSGEVPSGQILSAVVPVGQLDEVALRELARQPGLRAALDLMTTWRLPYAQALRQVRARRGATPDLDQLELALNQFHYRTLLSALGTGNDNRRILREQVQIEIDLINLRTALRVVMLPGITALVKQRYQAASIRPLFLEPGGTVPVSLLLEVASTSTNLENVVRSLADTPYSPALQAGWDRYRSEGGNVTMIERELERWRAGAAAGLFARNPLSIAIPIAYLAHKEIEISNLRLIAQAIVLDLNRETIKPDLIILADGITH